MRGTEIHQNRTAFVGIDHRQWLASEDVAAGTLVQIEHPRFDPVQNANGVSCTSKIPLQTQRQDCLGSQDFHRSLQKCSEEIVLVDSNVELEIIIRTSLGAFAHRRTFLRKETRMPYLVDPCDLAWSFENDTA